MDNISQSDAAHHLENLTSIDFLGALVASGVSIERAIHTQVRSDERKGYADGESEITEKYESQLRAAIANAAQSFNPNQPPFIVRKISTQALYDASSRTLDFCLPRDIYSPTFDPPKEDHIQWSYPVVSLPWPRVRSNDDASTAQKNFDCRLPSGSGPRDFFISQSLDSYHFINLDRARISIQGSILNLSFDDLLQGGAIEVSIACQLEVAPEGYSFMKRSRLGEIALCKLLAAQLHIGPNNTLEIIFNGDGEVVQVSGL